MHVGMTHRIHYLIIFHCTDDINKYDYVQYNVIQFIIQIVALKYNSKKLYHEIIERELKNDTN